MFAEMPDMTRPTRCARFEGPTGGNVLIHRSVFTKVGTFDPALVEAGEDIDCFRRVRKARIAIWLQPRAFVHHRVPQSRLELPALLAASRRVGWGFCRRDHREFGSFGLLAIRAARLVKLAMFGPLAIARRGSLGTGWPCSA